MAMRDNLQRKEYVQAEKQYQPNTQTYIQSVPQAQPKEKRKGWTVFQKATVSVLSLCVTGLCITTVAVSHQLQATNRNVQDVAHQITEVQVENNELEQSVSELSRYDRIYQIAEDYGLELNEQKVRNVTK